MTLATFSWLWPIFVKGSAHMPLFQGLLYSDERIIYSICSSLVMFTVHFKGNLSHFHIFSFLGDWEKYRSYLSDANDEVIPLRAARKHGNMDMTQKAPDGILGVPSLQWWKKNNSQMSCFCYFCNFDESLGLNCFWLHSLNRSCLFSDHETNHTITVEADLLELCCLL